MGVNRGKQFEQCVKDGFNAIPNTVVYRLQDSMGGFSGVVNICDFIIYNYPHCHFLECKSCHGNTWNFHNLSKGQYEGLMKIHDTKGIVAGVLLWFIDRDVTMFIPIKEIDRRIRKGDKSIRYTDDYYPIKGTKKRVLFDYDFSEYLKEVSDNGNV